MKKRYTSSTSSSGSSYSTFISSQNTSLSHISSFVILFKETSTGHPRSSLPLIPLPPVGYRMRTAKLLQW